MKFIFWTATVHFFVTVICVKPTEYIILINEGKLDVT